jgi:hypothetical protein
VLTLHNRDAWKTGIWAWDCALEECTLVIPFVAGLLGDNPMKSELSCHVGPGGKYLCRICNVKGAKKAMDHFPGAENPLNQGECDGPAPGDSVVAVGSGSGSVSAGLPTTCVCKKGEETMQEMVDRVTQFVQLC